MELTPLFAIRLPRSHLYTLAWYRKSRCYFCRGIFFSFLLYDGGRQTNHKTREPLLAGRFFALEIFARFQINYDFILRETTQTPEPEPKFIYFRNIFFYRLISVSKSVPLYCLYVIATYSHFFCFPLVRSYLRNPLTSTLFISLLYTYDASDQSLLLIFFIKNRTTHFYWVYCDDTVAHIMLFILLPYSEN